MSRRLQVTPAYSENEQPEEHLVDLQVEYVRICETLPAWVMDPAAGNAALRDEDPAQITAGGTSTVKAVCLMHQNLRLLTDPGPDVVCTL